MENTNNNHKKKSKKRKFSFNKKLSWNHRKRNPHLEQVFQYSDSNNYHNVTNYGHFTRILSSKAPLSEYYRRKGELKTVLHWGQRKLLLSEIEFLTSCTQPGESKTVIYTGAAPGTHVSFLSKLFPLFKFILYDPLAFEISSTNNIEIIQDSFSNNTCYEYIDNKERIILISDIRTTDIELKDNPMTQVSEDNVINDMKMQKQWVDILRPIHSLLKFRLPYCSGSTLYIDGLVLLPIWSPPTTTETRLLINDLKDEDITLRSYNHDIYNNQMFYFNTITRQQCYQYPSYLPLSINGYDHCYDCLAEIMILYQYYSKYQNKKLPEILEILPEMSHMISIYLSPYRSLFSV